jgi:hypothetical protein
MISLLRERNVLGIVCLGGDRSDAFLCAAFSAYKRVIADVAIFPVRGRRRKCADARRSNADRAAMMGGGGSARIGVLCEMPRGYMAVASHSGRYEHGSGDQCSRQKLKLSHLIFPLHMKSQRRVAPHFSDTASRLATDVDDASVVLQARTWDCLA